MTREITVTRVLAAPADVVWPLVTDVRRHGAWVPLTRIDADGPATRVGDRFTGVSGPTAGRGGRGLRDTMVVTRFDPPAPARGPAPAREGVARYRKDGPVLLGDADVRVRPLGPRHCTVTWVERVHLRGLPRAVGAALVTPSFEVMLRVVLRRVAAELVRDADHPAVAA